ncbi:hypothetical protein FRC07_014324, partial [Ceratobasidium sp. 392]
MPTIRTQQINNLAHAPYTPLRPRISRHQNPLSQAGYGYEAVNFARAMSDIQDNYRSNVRDPEDVFHYEDQLAGVIFDSGELPASVLLSLNAQNCYDDHLLFDVWLHSNYQTLDK